MKQTIQWLFYNDRQYDEGISVRPTCNYDSAGYI